MHNRFNPFAICVFFSLLASPCWSNETDWLENARQLTFEGKRAGEGYFSADGSLLVFQSERDAENPFYQIYLMDWETGDVSRVSPGQGKTTCAWVHPNNQLILFASTHHDPRSVEYQRAKLEQRAQGKEPRYAWDYDPEHELYTFDRQTKQYTRLTNTRGYDAECAYSPDGSQIVFSSNRRAYQGAMTPAEQAAFSFQKDTLCDIYVMNADGSNVRRLTETLGYDGGPFFSPDGKRICWRRFAASGKTAEIMTMNVDGTDKRQLTKLGAMSWAPYYHPSGEYLIFTTNLNGYNNFELYIVDAAGQHEPVRVTTTDGFDGLPSFTPDGKQLAWTSDRPGPKKSQIFLADWNHALALRSLDKEANTTAADPIVAASKSTAASKSSFTAADIMRHVDYLCRPELAGRMTGSQGEQLATSYVAAVFDHLGLEPVMGKDQWFHDFEFTAGVDLGETNTLQTNQGQTYQVDKDWRPLAFSKTGKVPASDIVFAGYGIAAPKDGDQPEYDSFVHLDVKDKWVCAFRFMPEDITPQRRQHLSGHSSLRYKAMVARDLGARGLIVASGPQSKVKQQLVKLQFDGSMGGSSIPVISVRDDVLAQWLADTGKSISDLQASLDTGEPAMGFVIDGVQLEADISIRKVEKRGRNVLARMKGAGNLGGRSVIVGAHIDHLGASANSSSLAREDEAEQIHFGADDNASGIAAMLEIAEYLSNQRRRGQLTLQHDVIFAAWSGEELGLIGSSEFAKEYAQKLAAQPATLHGHTDGKSLYPYIAACFNMDMVGRFEKRLVLQGVGSSSIWKGEIERRNAPIGLPITLQNDSYLPTDASTFYMRGVPILSAFTGSHSDYHTPRDTPEKLNYDAAAKIARLMGAIVRSVAMGAETPDYLKQDAPGAGEKRARLRASLGTVPDYAESDLKGVMLSDVRTGTPAVTAGIKGGDVVVELAGRKIENIYDYTYAIEALKIGEEVDIVVNRDGKNLTLKIIPGSRD